jgi:hypothetical protein
MEVVNKIQSIGPQFAGETYGSWLLFLLFFVAAWVWVQALEANLGVTRTVERLAA